MLDPAISSEMLKATVKVRWTFNKLKETQYWTGFIVGRVGAMVIILTTAHDAAPRIPDLKTLRAGGVNKLEAVLHGSEEAHGCYVESYIPKSEILLLSVMPGLKVFRPFIFASVDGEDSNLLNDQDVWTCSHPCGVEWCINRGEISRNYVPNKLERYDSDLIWFDYTMAIGVGSSGSAVVNEKGIVVGMQSGQVSDSTTIVNGNSFSVALTRESKMSKTMKPSLNLGKLCIEKDDIQVLKTTPCGLKHAVHVKYIDKVLRKEFSDVQRSKYLSLNALIEQHVKISHYLTSRPG